MAKILLIAIALTAIISSAVASCTNPKASVTSFSTQDSTILTQLAHVAEIAIQGCSNQEEPIIFAEFPCGKVVSTAKIGDAKYQISWTEDIKKSTSGNVIVRLFDEESYANLRKAQRDGDKVTGVKSLIDITIPTKGAYSGPWIKAELVAALLISVVGYFAVNIKSKIQS